MIMKTKTFFVLAAAAVMATSCSSFRKAAAPAPQPQTVNLSLVSLPQADKYANLEYGIRLNVEDGRADKRLIQVYDAAATSKPSVNVNPGIGSFIPESMRRYMRTMGLNMDADIKWIAYNPDQPQGDVDNDGKVANSDLITVARYVVDIIDPSTKSSIEAYGDMNGDGVITNADIITIARIIVGLD